MKTGCLSHHIYADDCNYCRLLNLAPKSGQEVEVHGFKTDEDGFWLLVSPDTIRIYKGMRLSEVSPDAERAKDSE